MPPELVITIYEFCTAKLEKLDVQEVHLTT